MSNVFKNIERAVEPGTKCFKKEYTELDKMSDAVACGEVIRKSIKSEKDKCEAAKCEKEKKVAETKERLDKVIMKTINQSKSPTVINKIFSDAKTGIFKDIVFEMFYKSLILDESFIAEQKSSLKYVTDQYIDNNGGFKLLEDAIKVNGNSELLKRMKSVCESIANDVCKRKIEDANNSENPEAIDFDMNDDEKNELDYSKDTLDVDRISSLVKKKVLTVVRDEQERAKDAEDAIAEIEDEVKDNLKDDKDKKDKKDKDSEDEEDTDVDSDEDTEDDDEDTDDDNEEDEEDTDDEKDSDKKEKGKEKTEESSIENIRRAYDKVVLTKSVIESGTLFNSLLRSTYRDFVVENVAITSADKDNIDDAHDRSENYDINSYEEDIMDDEDDIETSEINDDLIFEEAGSPSINMDLVFAEAITKYTLMEMLYTVKLENYTYENINKLTEKLLNPVTESKNKDSGENKAFGKVRKEFFSHFNKILNLNNIEKQQAKLEKMKSKCSDEELFAFKSCVGTAIKEIESAKEKNPQFKDKYNDVAKWLKTLK